MAGEPPDPDDWRAELPRLRFAAAFFVCCLLVVTGAAALSLFH